jgi:hypothetical protein
LFEESLSSEVASLQCAQIVPTDASLILSTEAHRLELLRQELFEIRNLLSIHG